MHTCLWRSQRASLVCLLSRVQNCWRRALEKNIIIITIITIIIISSISVITIITITTIIIIRTIVISIIIIIIIIISSFGLLTRRDEQCRPPVLAGAVVRAHAMHGLG